MKAEYRADPNWDTAKTRKLAQRLGLDRIRIYKWHYDQTKKGRQGGEEDAESIRFMDFN